MRHRRQRSVGHVGAAIKIARQGLFQLRFIVQNRLIGIDAAIEGAGHFLDARTDPHVGDTHFAQRAIHVGEHQIEQSLRHAFHLAPFGAEAMQQQKDMRHQHVEAAIHGVGDFALRVKDRLPGLRYRLGVQRIDHFFFLPAPAEPPETHKQSP